MLLQRIHYANILLGISFLALIEYQLVEKPENDMGVGGAVVNIIL